MTTYQQYLADPQRFQEQVELAARRMRAEALRRAFFELADFCGRLLAVRGVKLLLDPRPAA